MSKDKVNEGLFGAAKKFSDAFFDGLKNNATNSMLSKAKKQGMPSPVIQQMQKLRKEKQELDALIKKYSK
jgi:hypothetical protein